VSAQIEYALISKVIETHNFQELDKQQITADFFLTPEMRTIYEFLRYTYHNPQTAGLVPSADMIRQYYPGFNMVYAPDDVPVLAQAVRRGKLQADLFQLSQIISLGLDADPEEVFAKVRQSVSSMSAMENIGADLSMSAAYQLLMQRYTQVASAKGLLGIPFPWERLNQETQGMQNGQYIVLYARPKNMKSWVAIYMAVFAYLKARRRVLYYTREMPNIQIAQRVAAAMAGIDYRSFINGNLDPNILQYFQAVMQGLIQDEVSAGKHGHQPCFVITADKSAKGGGVSWLRAKIKEVKPDLVFVDGVYLMSDDRSGSRQADWKNILHVSQDIRQIALNENLPVVAITQANKKSDQIRGNDDIDMAYTDAFNQDADAVFKLRHRMRRDEQTGMKHSEIDIFAPNLREGIIEGIVINGVPATDFSYIRDIKAEEEQSEPEYGAEKKQPKIRPPGASFSKSAGNYYDPVIPALKK